jgi:Flp pilus assembly protein TadG
MILRLPVCLKRLQRDQRGATIVEMALVATPMIILLLGSVDVGFNLYMRTVLSGALEKAARSTTIETANSTAVDTEISNTIKTVMPSATVTVSKGRLYRYNQLNQIERLTTDTNGNGTLDSGDCYEDIDNDSTRSTVTTGELNSIGGSDDIVRYVVTVSYPRLTPITKFTGGSDTQTLSNTMLVKRQPYGNQGSPTVRCKP